MESITRRPAALFCIVFVGMGFAGIHLSSPVRWLAASLCAALLILFFFIRPTGLSAVLRRNAQERPPVPQEIRRVEKARWNRPRFLGNLPIVVKSVRNYAKFTLSKAIVQVVAQSKAVTVDFRRFYPSVVKF